MRILEDELSCTCSLCEARQPHAIVWADGSQCQTSYGPDTASANDPRARHEKYGPCEPQVYSSHESHRRAMLGGAATPGCGRRLRLCSGVLMTVAQLSFQSVREQVRRRVHAALRRAIQRAAI